MITIRDVAKRAGVSAITVSRVINNSGSVSSITREQVRRAIQELHYVPNSLARNLRSRQTHTLALVVSDITNPFWTTLARGVEDTAARNGFHVILCNTDEDPTKQANYIDLLLQRQVDGILLAPTANDPLSLTTLKRQNVPCVLIDRRVDSFKADLVTSDNREGARQLTRHLIQLGHRHIAMVSGPDSISTARERIEGYCQALQENGIPVVEALIRRGGYKEDSGRQLVCELLAVEPRPTALFAANNSLAVGALQALHEAGLQVPDDIALVCFDDIPQASSIYPFLTVVAQRPYEMGATAAQLLMERLASQKHRKVREIILDTQLVIRKSCGHGLGPASHSED